MTALDAPPAMPAEPPAPGSATGGSLRDRIRQRRQELQKERSFVLPVSGYEDLLAARYRVMSYEEFRAIGRRHEAIQDTADGELAMYADTLINACVELLEVDEDGNQLPTGKKWSTDTIRDYFGVDLPEGTTVRQALQLALTSNELALHFRAYDLKADKIGPQVETKAEGESVASAPA